MHKTDNRALTLKPMTRWYWPLRPLSFVVLSIVLVVAFFANFPAVEVPYPHLNQGKYGPHFEGGTELRHGWPARYVRRSTFVETVPPAVRNSWRLSSPWMAWQTVEEFWPLGLVANFLVWTLALVVAVASAQYWRAQRRAIWQWTLKDILGATTITALVLGWFTYHRIETRREQQIGASQQVELERDCAVPLFLPKTQQDAYRQIAGRTTHFSSSGKSDLAFQLKHLLTLSETDPLPNFADHLRKMPQLQALDLCLANLPFDDERDTHTLLRNLPPMSNLRGINLYGTAATDEDMAWLAKCPRLEMIDLTDTYVGDAGLAKLCQLPTLRFLSISGGKITDEGCRFISQMESLEDLWLGSPDVHDVGVEHLAKLKRLRSLSLSVKASQAAISQLHKTLPQCEIRGSDSP